jgi:SAM-dependent methyltransferase
MKLSYTPGEKLSTPRPVDRVNYIREVCIGKNVLDLGCYDETALIKENTGKYLFTEISKVAKLHFGIDNSAQLPNEGITFSPTEKIIKGDIYNLHQMDFNQTQFDVIIAGELIEHLPNTLDFFKHIKQQYPGKKLICSTPNTTSFSNIALAFFKRESCHIDHFQVYSYKTLNTLCRVAGFDSWKIIPYHVKFTEMIERSVGIKKLFVSTSEKIVNGVEILFPLVAGGYILEIDV